MCHIGKELEDKKTLTLVLTLAKGTLAFEDKMMAQFHLFE